MNETQLNAALIEKPMDVVSGWWCEVNCWRWPADFPIPKPSGFDDVEPSDHEGFRFIWRVLSAFVPEKEKARAWHKGGYCGERKTDEEFEAWYASPDRIQLP